MITKNQVAAPNRTPHIELCIKIDGANRKLYNTNTTNRVIGDAHH